MSPIRLAVGALALVTLTLSSAWTVASALPLRTEHRYRTVAAVTAPIPQPPLSEPSPSPADGKTNPRAMVEVKAAYPDEALRHSPGATVWVKVTIGPGGEVAEAKAARWRLTIEESIEDPNYWANKPERAFIDAAEAAALKWKFAPPDANTRTAVELMFTFRNIRGTATAGAPDAARGVASAVRVGGNIRPPVKIVDARPVYPEDARAAGVEGVVTIDIRIGVDGSVVDATVLRSIPQLDDAAVTAVRRWRYTPTLLNGQPIEILMTVTINFVV